MNCENVRQILNEFIDGELDEMRARRLSHHLVECKSCAMEEQRIRQVIKLVAGCGFQKAPEGFLEAVHIGIGKEELPVEKKFGSARALALAASFFIALASGYYFNIFNSPPQSALMKAKEKPRAMAEVPAAQPQTEEAAIPELARETVAAVPMAEANNVSPEMPVKLDEPLKKIEMRRIIDSPKTVDSAQKDIMDDSQASSMSESERASEALHSAIDAREEIAKAYKMPAPAGRAAARSFDTGAVSAPAIAEVSYKRGRAHDIPFEYFEAPSDADAVDYMIARNIESLRRTRGEEMEGGAEKAYALMATTADEARPANTKYLRGSNTFKAENPAEAAAKCEKFISSMIGSKGGAVLHRRDNLLVVSGKFSTLASLRVYALNGCSDDSAPKLSKNEIQSMISESTKSQNVGPDFPAILDLHFVK